MENLREFIKSRKRNRIYRYSIRRLSIGVVSCVVGAFVLFAPVNFGKAELSGVVYATSVDGKVLLKNLESKLEQEIKNYKEDPSKSNRSAIYNNGKLDHTLFVNEFKSLLDKIDQELKDEKAKLIEELLKLEKTKIEGNQELEGRIRTKARKLISENNNDDIQNLKEFRKSVKNIKEEKEEREREKEREEQTRREKEEQARRDKEEQARREREEQARRDKEEQARRDKEEQARRDKEEQARREKEEQARREKEEQARREKEEQARRDKEEQARREKEEKEEREREKEREEQTRREKEEQARREKEEQARREKEEQARRDKEEKARRDKEEKARREKEEQARRDKEEKARREKEEQARREKEEQARREKEEQARREKEEQARREKEEQARREREEQARRDKEEKARREKEEQARRDKEEKARREKEEQARRDKEEKPKEVPAMPLTPGIKVIPSTPLQPSIKVAPRAFRNDNDQRGSIDWRYIKAPSKDAKAEVQKQKTVIELKIKIGSDILQRTINNHTQETKMDTKAIIKDGRTMLPIRYVAEALGYTVEWREDTRIAILKDKNTTIEIPVDTNKIIVNGKEIQSDVKPMIENGRTMLPIANVARALG
ncbi:stalk domain-containing protein, partial [Peptoniphilus indolicus]